MNTHDLPAVGSAPPGCTVLDHLERPAQPGAGHDPDPRLINTQIREALIVAAAEIVLVMNAVVPGGRSDLTARLESVARSLDSVAQLSRADPMA